MHLTDVSEGRATVSHDGRMLGSVQRAEVTRQAALEHYSAFPWPTTDASVDVVECWQLLDEHGHRLEGAWPTRREAVQVLCRRHGLSLSTASEVDDDGW